MRSGLPHKSPSARLSRTLPRAGTLLVLLAVVGLLAADPGSSGVERLRPGTLRVDQRDRAVCVQRDTPVGDRFGVRAQWHRYGRRSGPDQRDHHDGNPGRERGHELGGVEPGERQLVPVVRDELLRDRERDKRSDPHRHARVGRNRAQLCA